MTEELIVCCADRLRERTVYNQLSVSPISCAVRLGHYAYTDSLILHVSSLLPQLWYGMFVQL